MNGSHEHMRRAETLPFPFTPNSQASRKEVEKGRRQEAKKTTRLAKHLVCDYLDFEIRRTECKCDEMRRELADCWAWDF